MALNSYLVLFFSWKPSWNLHKPQELNSDWDMLRPTPPMLHFHPSCKHVFFHIFVTSNTQGPCFSTHFRERFGPCFDSKEVFRGRETGRIPSCGNRSWQLKGVRMPQTGSPWHCCHGRHGYYDFTKKRWVAPDLCSTSLEWCSNNCQYLETHSFWPKRSMEILQKIPLLSGLCLESSEVWWDAWLGPNG